MELKELYNESLKILGVTNAEEIPKALYQEMLSNTFTLHNKFKELVDIDLTKDYMQMIFQYYLADREEKKQDYTPASQGRLLAKLTKSEHEKVCLDLCAGSGSLTIQKWVENPLLKFICKEIDENVIPMLLFNLSIRNIEGEVVQENIITEKVMNIYRLEKGNEFSFVKKVDKQLLKADTCVSNPPFNIKWEDSGLGILQTRFAKYGVPPESNANLLFLLTGFRDVEERASFIFPNSLLMSNNKYEKEIIKNLVEYNQVESLIICPNKMFESVDIGTTIITLNKKKTNATISMVDARKIFTEENREQRGQYGGASHTNRVYTKKIHTFSEENIENILQKLKSSSVSIEEIRKEDYVLNVGKYLEIEMPEVESREYSHIMNDLNRVIRQKNCFKLTINETLARSMGFDDKLFKNTKDENKSQFEENIKKITGQSIEQNNYISFSKNKNEIKFENKSNNEISPILPMLLQSWKQHIIFLNVEENRYLAELRDKALQELMSGKIEL